MKFLAEYSLFYLLPIVLVAGLLTWFFFVRDGKLKEMPSWSRKAVYFLRFLVLCLIGFLLLGILFEYTKIEKEKPILITLLDNSSSMLNYKDSSEVKKQMNSFMQDMEKNMGEKYEQVSYQLGNEFRESGVVDLTDTKSNLSTAFETIFSRYYNRNIGGIILLSDGNFNEGQNPYYAASKIALTPIFTLGVGDTIAKKDQLIKDVLSNEIAFLKNKFPVEVDLESNKMGKVSTKVSIYHKGKKLAEQVVAYTDPYYDSKQLLFELEATEAGFQQYDVVLQSENGEYTLKNNRKSFYIEVLDAHNKIVILSAAPHPDIYALKEMLKDNENLQVEAVLLEKWDRKLSQVDLIVWHDPARGFSDPINQLLMESKVPVWYFLGPTTNTGIINRLNIGLKFNGSGRMDEVQGGVNSGFDLFEISKELKQELAQFPPVKTIFGSPQLGSQNKVFLNQRLVNIQKNDPLFYFGSVNVRKYGVFVGDGIWRWKMANYQKHGNFDLFRELVQKSSQYLVQKENSSKLRISLPKRFLKNEDVLIKAEFYNESMELVTKPKIELTLVDEQGKKSEFEFAVNGNMYLLPLGKLKAGSYSWEARTNFSGKKHTKKGSFVVENTQIEKMDTRANHGLLTKISKQSRGDFFALKDYKKLLDQIQNRADITPIAYEQSSNQSLLDYIYLLLAVLLLLGGEWFLKRWYGFY